MNILEEVRDGELVFRDGQLVELRTDGGWFSMWNDTLSTTQVRPYFYVTDYLGSVRMVCDGITGEVRQSLEYLPSGYVFRSDNYAEQPYMFCGKELVKMHGINLYDSNARFQHYDIPRFTALDPLAYLNYDKSPYMYSSCDPVNKIDPFGLTDYYNLDGRLVHHVDDDSDYKYLVLTFENDIDAIQKTIGEGYYIFISSASFLDLIKESYKKTVQQNKEFGFMAGQKGGFSSIVMGTSNSIKKEWESAVEELCQIISVPLKLGRVKY